MDDFVLYFELVIHVCQVQKVFIVKERVSDMKSFVCCVLPNNLSLWEISFICACGTLFLCIKIFTQIFHLRPLSFCLNQTEFTIYVCLTDKSSVLNFNDITNA